MIRRRLVLGAVAVAAIGLLSLLFVLSRSADPGAHARVVDLMGGIRASEERLGRVLLQISTRRLLTYDPSVAAEQSLDRSLAALRRDPAMQDAYPAMLLNRYAAIAGERRVLVEHFKSADAIYRNSSLYVPLLAHDIGNRVRAAGHQDIADAIAEWDQSLFLRLSGRTSEEALDGAAQRLRALTFGRPEISADIALLATHALMLMRDRNASSELLDRILDLSRGDLLSELYRFYMERHVAADRRAGRVLYALYAAAFFCVLGLVMAVVRLDRLSGRLVGTNQLLSERARELESLSIKLQREIRQRQSVQAALQHHRDDLEREVAARTADLVASEGRLVEAIETIPEGFVLFDARDRLVLCNTAYREIYGFTEAVAAPGVTFEALVRDTIGRGLFGADQDFEAVLRERLALHHAVTTEDRPTHQHLTDGRWIEFHERRTGDGGIVGLRIDVTDARRHEAAEGERNKLAALGQLAGGVAHEINNLLQPALTFPELVRDRLPPEDVESREDLDLVTESVRKAREIVRNILLFSRKELPTLETVDLAAETGAALNFVRDLLPPGIALQQHIGVARVMAAVNKTQLTQVLTNLVVNAVHATGDNGTIEVTVGQARPSEAEAAALGVEAGPDYLTLTVSDHGTGMDEATQARIFEPFFTTKPMGEGTGLGLSVVFGILRSWRGAVTVDSAVGRGTKFTLYIPTMGPTQPTDDAAQIAA